MTKMALKRSLFKAARKTGVVNLGRLFGRGAVVVCYHGVEPTRIDSFVQDLHLPLMEFERQIKYLKTNFDIISIDELEERIRLKKKIYPRTAVITFDDGYRNNLLYAAPFLQSLGIPFTLFVSTDHIDRGNRFPGYYLKAGLKFANEKRIHLKRTNLDYDLSTETFFKNALKDLIQKVNYREKIYTSNLLEDLKDLLNPDQWKELDERFISETPLTWDEIKTLSTMGCTIGSHCHEHVLLCDLQPQDEVSRQLKLSKETITKHLGKCDYFCYPNGDMKGIGHENFLLLKQHGYKLGFTSIEGEVGEKTNPYLLPRVGAFDFESFTALINLAWKFNPTFDAWEKHMQF